MKSELEISMASLKKSQMGDQIVVVTTENTVEWLEVVINKGQPGCNGGTTFILKNVLDDTTTTYFVKNDLPARFKKVRRVSAGVNSRTLNKAISEPKAKVELVQPEGEFENILDVPLEDE